MSNTQQEQFWSSKFGHEYTERNKWDNDEEWDKTYCETWGMTKLEINDKVLKDFKNSKFSVLVATDVAGAYFIIAVDNIMNRYGHDHEDDND